MPSIEAATLAKLTSNLDRARAAFENAPDSEEAIIWYGRRLGYLTRYEDAIAVYTEGLKTHPASYRLLRHRGHRYISVRKLDLAILDFERAAVLAGDAPLRTEADGVPNQRKTPIGNTQGNIWYHLGLARYLKGDLDGALLAYDQRFLKTDRNDDNHVSTAYWRFIILSRLNRPEAAKASVAHITASMDVIENQTYWDLALLYKGERSVDQIAPKNDGVHSDAVTNSTLSYGLSMQRWMQGETAKAQAMWQGIIASHTATSAFGYIAAEAELAGH